MISWPLGQNVKFDISKPHGQISLKFDEDIYAHQKMNPVNFGNLMASFLLTLTLIQNGQTPFVHYFHWTCTKPVGHQRQRAHAC